MAKYPQSATGGRETSHGARIGGPPAIDREFKTIDFLTLFDVDAMPERMRRLFFDP
jgi:putative hemolysin